MELQAAAGGDAMIGRQLYPLMTEAGLEGVQVSARMVYVDASRPELVDGFTRKTFTAMIEGMREHAIAAGLIAPARFDEGVAALHRAADAGWRVLLHVLQGHRKAVGWGRGRASAAGRPRERIRKCPTALTPGRRHVSCVARRSAILLAALAIPAAADAASIAYVDNGEVWLSSLEARRRPPARRS